MASSPTVNINGNLNINNASVKKSASQVQSAFNNIKINPQSLDKFGNSLGRITGNASEFQKSMDAATARVFAFGATAAVIQTINQSFKALVSSTIQVEKRLVEINSILGASDQQFSKFRKSIFDVAKNTEQSFSTVADGAAELARQGLSAEQTAKRLNAALILTRISGLDSVSSVNALTAAINGYTSAALSAEQIVNKLVAVDTAFAVSAKDLADGFQRAGSTAEDAGVSFDELLGLITAVQQKTARGGAVIGNAFKSIFTRLSRSTTISELQDLGVAIDSNQTGVQKLQALASSLDNIADPTRASKIKELAGGVFQINVVSAALKDLSSETSLYAQASNIAAKASNEAFVKNEALNKTLSSQINSLVVGLTNLAEKVGTITLAPVISDLVGLAEKLTNFLDSSLSEDKGFSIVKNFFKGIGTFIQGPGLILITGAFLNIFKIVSKFAIQGFKDLSTLGSGQEKIKSIEQGIVSLLTQDVNLRKQLANASLSQSQKEQLVLNAIKQENALLREQQAIISSLAAASARRGVASFSPSGGFKGKKGKRFAGGFTPEDGMMEVMEAVSLGASRSVKPQMGQGTIGGKKFLMNSQEVELPNFGMNGDSAVIPLYASGNIPRFAGGKFDFLTTAKQVMAKQGKRANSQADEEALAARLKVIESQSVAPTILDPTGFPFMVPSKAAITPALQTTKQTTIKGRAYKLSKTPSVYTPNLVNLDKVDDPHDVKLEENVTKGITDSSLKYAKLLDPPVKNQPTRADVEKHLNMGTVAAAVGVAFESAVVSALKLANPKNGRFDVADFKNKTELKQLFNIEGKQKAGDFKNSTSSGNIKSFIGKILSHPTNAALRPKKTAKGKGRASGFMPRSKAVGRMPRMARGGGGDSDFGGGGSRGLLLASFFLPQIIQTASSISTSGEAKKLQKLNNDLERISAQISRLETESQGKAGPALDAINDKIKTLKSSLKETTNAVADSSDEIQKTSDAFTKVGAAISSLAVVSSFLPEGSVKKAGKKLGVQGGKNKGARNALKGGAALIGIPAAFELGQGIGGELLGPDIQSKLGTSVIDITGDNAPKTKGEFMGQQFRVLLGSIGQQMSDLKNGNLRGLNGIRTSTIALETIFAAFAKEETLIGKDTLDQVERMAEVNEKLAKMRAAREESGPIKLRNRRAIGGDARAIELENFMKSFFSEEKPESNLELFKTSLDSFFKKQIADTRAIQLKNRLVDTSNAVETIIRSLEAEASNIKTGQFSESGATRFLNVQKELIESLNSLSISGKEELTSALDDFIKDTLEAGKKENEERRKINKEFIENLRDSFLTNLEKLEKLNTNQKVTQAFRSADSPAKLARFLTDAGISDKGVRGVISAGGKDTSSFAKAILQGAGTDIRKAIFGDRKTGLMPTLPVGQQLTQGQKDLFKQATSGFDPEILNRLTGFQNQTGRVITQTGVNRIKSGLSNANVDTVGGVGQRLAGLSSALKALSQLRPTTQKQASDINEISTVLGAQIEQIEAAILVNSNLSNEEQQTQYLEQIAKNTAPKTKIEGGAGGGAGGGTGGGTGGGAGGGAGSEPVPYGGNPPKRLPSGQVDTDDMQKKAEKDRLDRIAKMEEAAKKAEKDRLDRIAKMQEAEKKAQEDRMANNKKLQDAADKTERDRLIAIGKAYQRQIKALESGGDGVSGELDKLAVKLQEINNLIFNIGIPPTPKAPPKT